MTQDEAISMLMKSIGKHIDTASAGSLFSSHQERSEGAPHVPQNAPTTRVMQ